MHGYVFKYQCKGRKGLEERVEEDVSMCVGVGKIVGAGAVPRFDVSYGAADDLCLVVCIGTSSDPNMNIEKA